MKFSFTRVSGNEKTGPIPTVMVTRDTCPPSCPLYKAGCYARAGMVRIHWDRVEERGMSLESLAANVAALPRNQVWRYGVAGDLPGAEEDVDAQALQALCHANTGKRGFAYTHKNPYVNRKAIQQANQSGFTINLSANNLAQADDYLKLGIAPVVVLIPHDISDNKVAIKKPSNNQRNIKTVPMWKTTATPAGNRVVQCPAEYQDSVQCATCGGKEGPLCSRRDRKFIVGFTAHGISKAATSRVARGLQVIQ
jgi:hypothetical protein